MPTTNSLSPNPVEVHVVNAFTVDGNGGNPAGVVLDADLLGEARVQAIASETGLSKTVFVVGSRLHRHGAGMIIAAVIS